METKSKYISILLFLLLLLLGLVIWLLVDYNSELKLAIEKRDKTINEIIENDSLYEAKTKKYSEVITKYISDCNFYVNNKKVSTAEVISLFNKYIEENAKLKDSLSYSEQANEVNSSYKDELVKSKDSLLTYKKILEIIYRDYGISYNVVSNENYKVLTKNAITKVDSAMLLFPYFKEKLSYDSVSENWVIVKTETNTTTTISFPTNPKVYHGTSKPKLIKRY